MNEINTRLFTTMADHLLAQGCQSKSLRCGDRLCAYRGESGRKCAAGSLIDDAHYTPGLEGMTADEPSVMQSIRASQGIKGKRVDWDMICDVQGIHDDCCPDRWITELEAAARHYSIEWSPK